MAVNEIDRVEALVAELDQYWPKGNPRVERFDAVEPPPGDWWPEFVVVVDSIPWAFGIHGREQRVAFPLSAEARARTFGVLSGEWATLGYMVRPGTGVRRHYKAARTLSTSGESPAVRLLEACAKDIRSFMKQMLDTFGYQGTTLRQQGVEINNAFVDLEARAMFIDDAIAAAQRDTLPSSKQ